VRYYRFMDASAYFNGKKITVMGLGLLGRGLGDVRYLASCGAELTVTDLKSAEALSASIDALKEYSGITYVLGEHRLEDFRDKDFILKAAGVPFDSLYIEEARTAGIPIKMSASLFAELAGIPIIGITGTRGKSTTTYMLHSILEKAGKKVLLGGNVRGVSTLELLPQVTPEHVGLFELDSWQLQGFAEAGISPNLSIFTTFFPDHLNYYHNDLDAYLHDKAAIFVNQKPEDTLILGSQCAGIIQEKYAAFIPSKYIVIGESELPADLKLSIPGEHNRYDAALAFAAANILGIPQEDSILALETFEGVEGRLQLVRTVDGVGYYNDSNSTTPEAGTVALEALGQNHKGRIVLIMGGADKNLVMDSFIALIPEFTKRVVLLAGTGTDRIRELVPEAEVYNNLAMAVEDARAHVEPGDVIVLSPSFASFGMFMNEYDRGDQFTAMVNAL
jgi:UDP-N-acetylmuramoylalanine--D-glutamate ligase